MTDHDLTRRALGGAALLGLTAPLLAACGDDSSSDGSAGSSPDSGGSSAGNGGGTSGAAGGGLVAAADVPVGGGVIVKEQEVVVTQPAEGTFKGFSAICTHQGCLLADVTDGQINCNCHGSAFSAEDGSVVNGPATTPLDEVPVKVQGGEVVEG